MLPVDEPEPLEDADPTEEPETASEVIPEAQDEPDVYVRANARVLGRRPGDMFMVNAATYRQYRRALSAVHRSL